MIVFAALLAGAAPGIDADAVVHRVDASGDVAVRITVDKKHSVDLKGTGVTLTLNGDALVVAGPARAEGERAVVTVVVDSLSAVTSSGSARVEIASYAGKTLAITAGKMSTIVLGGARVDKLAIDARGTAHVDADQITAGAVTADLGDAARVEVRVADKGSLACNLKRASRLTMSGHPNPKDVKTNVEGVARFIPQ